MSSTYQAGIDALGLNKGPELTSETRGRLLEVAKKVDAMVSEIEEKILLLCPVDVVLAFLEYVKQMQKLHEARNVQEFVQILATRGKVYEAVRNAAGVEPLSAEMLKIFGVPPDRYRFQNS
jgi:hypothetical protein